MSKKELNVLVVENNYDHIAHIRKELKNVLDETKFSEQYVLNVYPENKDLAIHDQISTISEEIREGKREVEFLFEFIKNIIEEKNIDFIALDFLLSANEEKNIPIKIVDTTGAKLLKLIKEKYPKLPVMSFTKVADSLKTTPLVGKLLLFDLPKNFSLDFFAKNLSSLYKLFQEVDTFQKHRNLGCHIAIVCALQAELDAVLKLDFQWEDFTLYGKKYYKGKICKKIIIATTENKMGMPEAASMTTRVIDVFKPKYVVMTGIAAGVDPKDQEFLDLLIPDRIFNWQAGKYKTKNIDDEFEEKTLHIFEKDYRSETTFFDHDNTINFNDLINNAIQKVNFENVSISRPPQLNVWNDGMVSGSAVVADKDIVKDQIDGRKIYGIDMEAYGVVFACNNSPHKSSPIIIKSICDFADKDKNDDYQSLAMSLSAHAFHTLFTEYIDAEQ